MPGHFTFDGKVIPYQAADTYGSALHRAGVKVLSRSLRYHRPRGLYCCSGSCAGCLVEVDGVPNVAACMATPRDGATVVSQNRLGSAKHDLLGIVDKVYRRGFDPHNAFTRPQLLNKAFLTGVRMMSGLGRVPPKTAAKPAPPQPAAPAATAQPRRHVLEVDDLVVGAGLRGLQRAQAYAQGTRERTPAHLRKATRRILLIDELDALGGSARWDPSEAETVRLAQAASSGAWPGVEVWTGALCFGLYPDGAGHVAAVRRGDDLWEIRAARITLAPGRHDAWPLFANNDLPGVLSLRGARRLLGEHGVLPGRRIVVHGAALPQEFTAELEAQGASVVATGAVAAAKGSSCVTKAQVDGQWVACDAIVCNVPGTPRVELFQQAGCELGFGDEGVLAPRCGPDGATSRSHIVAAFSPAPAFAQGPTPRTLRAAAAKGGAA